MRHLHSFGLRGSHSVITSVASRSALVLLASLAVACGSADEKEKQAWNCRGANVPLGESVECSSTIAQKLLEGVTSSDGVSGVSYDGSGTDAIIRWDCSSTATSILCPNSGYAVGGYSTDVGGATATSTDGTSTGGTSTGGLPTSGGVSGDGTSGTGTGTGTGTGGTGTGGLPTAGGASGDGTGTGGTGTGGTGTGTGTGTGGTGTGGLPGAGSASGDGSGTGGTGTGTGSGTNTGTGGTGTGGNPGAGGVSGDGGGTTGSGLAPECAYGPDLSYCGPPTSTDGTGTGATGGSTGGTTGTGTNGNGNGNGAGGNGNGNGSSTGGTDGTGTGGNPSAGGTSTDGSGSTTGGNGNGNGNGNGGAGNGKGNGNTPTTTDGSGNKPTGGKAGGGFTCVTQHGETTCITKKPSCVQGAKPSACGACVPAGSNEGDCQPPSQGGCWITGGGFIPVATGGNGKATFGGNGKPMKDGRIQGEWNHVDHGTGGHVHGQVRYLVCRHVDEPGPGMPGGNKNFIDNQAYFGGPARYAPTGGTMAEGFWFDVFVEDHGEPGNKPGPGNHGSKGPDEYQLVLRKQADPAKQQSGTIVYQAPLGDLGGGNIQLHPPNGGHPATASSLPQWVSYQE